MRVARTSFALTLFATVALCQSFEAASIRESGPASVRGSEGGPESGDPVRYTFGRATLMDFILVAYHVETFQISSKLPLDRDEFDLTATMAAHTSKDEFRAMMRNLLAERFHMRAHVETRNFPAFELVVAKGGPKLSTTRAAGTASDASFPQLTEGKPGMTARNSTRGAYILTQIRAQQQPVSRLASMLRTAEPRPIVDQTGLTDPYDFTLEFSTELPGNASAIGGQPPGAPDLNTALRDQLGLQIVPKNLPFDVVVVESFERHPTGN
ncbi:MAG TPA: TIGR03435 family protein [Tepidisphaeraceae bacterium]|nr:TIGR03435 family protein [Tepidisphaeraceae bacterium]